MLRKDAPGADRDRSGPKRVYIDATLALVAVSRGAPTGIPRFEDFLARWAAADNDPVVQVVVYDSKSKSYREITDHELIILRREVVEQRQVELNKRGPVQLLREALRAVKGNPNLDKAYDREVAAKVAGGAHQGINYTLVKMIVRVYRLWIAKTIIKKFIDPGDGLVLMSHSSIDSSRFPDTLQATRRRAFVCYDLIPIFYPEFAMDKQHVSRFEANFKTVVLGGALGLCISNATQEMLTGFNGRVGAADVRSKPFPMPSLLYSKANILGQTSRFKPAEPFVLYCSTIEARKNHLILAEIWKRAQDDGVMLPKLVCAGKWGWGVERLSDYMKANKSLAGSVHFTGAVAETELIDLYRSALFCVMPSRVEGWGFGASESLDFGVPVIVSTAPALIEAVQGLMPAIDADDQAGWYAMIRLLSEDQGERRALCAKIASRYHRIDPSETWAVIKSACLEYLAG